MEKVINSDPTLKSIINFDIDYKLFDWHIAMKSAAIMIALRIYLNEKY